MKGEEPSGQVERESEKGSALSPRKKLNVHTEQEASVEAQQKDKYRGREKDNMMKRSSIEVGEKRQGSFINKKHFQLTQVAFFFPKK